MKDMEQTQVIQKTLELKSKDFRRFLISWVHSPEDAEDLFQQGVLRALEKAPLLKDPAKVKPWLLSLYRNLALDFLRSKKKAASKFTSDAEDTINLAAPTPEEAAPEKVCGCGKKLMKEIPKQYSELLESIDLNGSSIGDTAKSLGTTVNNVSVKLHRARKSLKHAVQDHCEIETLAECLECGCPDS